MSGHDSHHSRVFTGSTDPHALPSMSDPATREPARWYCEPDEIELACPMCTLEYRDGRWQYSRACIFG